MCYGMRMWPPTHHQGIHGCMCIRYAQRYLPWQWTVLCQWRAQQWRRLARDGLHSIFTIETGGQEHYVKCILAYQQAAWWCNALRSVVKSAMKPLAFRCTFYVSYTLQYVVCTLVLQTLLVLTTLQKLIRRWQQLLLEDRNN